MRFYSVCFALICITQLVYNAIFDGLIKNFLGIAEDVKNKPKHSNSDYLALINQRLAEYEKKTQKEAAAAGGTHNIANLNTLKNNISLPDIQMPPITVVVVKDKKALEKYQKEANGSSTLIIKEGSKAPKT